MTQEALKLALEALETYQKENKYLDVCNPTIRIIKEALAQPEPIQVTIKDFVAVVEGKEDWVGKPVYWAQWPNKEQL